MAAASNIANRRILLLSECQTAAQSNRKQQQQIKTRSTIVGAAAALAKIYFMHTLPIHKEKYFVAFYYCKSVKSQSSERKTT